MVARALPLALASVLAVVPGALAGSTGASSDGTQTTPAAPQAQAPVQARPGWTDAAESPRTDETVDVAKGTRLVLSSQAGEVIVRAWDRDAVRVQARHSPRDRVDVQSGDNTLRIRTRGTRGPGGVVDYAVTVPRWMPVNISGTYLAATIEGTTAEVSVETVGGDLTLKGGSGTVSLRSIEGEIRAEGASGKLNLSTVNDSITLTGVAGDVVAETVNGDVTITGAKASSLEISTVNGDVRVESTTTGKGTYRVSTHQGDIRVSLGQQASATVFVRTFRGDFSSDFPVTLPTETAGRDSNKRFNFTLGAGAARVELQSFQGDIHVSKGPLRTREEERARRKKRGGDEHQAFHFPLDLPSVDWTVPAVPAVPAAPAVLAVPAVPAVLGVPAVPVVPAVPGVPAVLAVPAVPVVAMTPLPAPRLPRGPRY